MSKAELAQARESAGSWGRIVPARLNLALEYAGSSVLDLGCSSGAYVAKLTERGLAAVGLDLLPDSAWAGGPGRPFVVGDAAALPFRAGAFETVLAFEVLEHQKDLPAVLAELHRVVGKHLVLSVPNCVEPAIFGESGLAFHHWTDRTHVQFFTPDTLAQALKEQGFTLERLLFCNPIAVDKLFFASWRLPERLASFLGNITKKLPGRRNYFMTILAAARKV